MEIRNRNNYVRFIHSVYHVDEEDITEEMIINTRKVIDELNDKETMVIDRHYGLIDGKCKSFIEIANEYGVTETRIKGLYDLAMKKLKHPVRANKIK